MLQVWNGRNNPPMVWIRSQTVFRELNTSTVTDTLNTTSIDPSSAQRCHNHQLSHSLLYCSRFS